MKKSLYIWIEIKSDDGCDYLDVQLAKAHLRIYDLKSILFFESIEQIAANFDGVVPLRYMINIPATGNKIVCNCYAGARDFMPNCVVPFDSLCQKWFKNNTDVPDIIALLSLFMSSAQRKLCYV